MGALLWCNKAMRSLPPLSIFVFALSLLIACSHEQDATAGSPGAVDVTAAWARPSLPPHENSAAFFVVHNRTDHAVQLLGASTSRAGVTELHHMEMDGDRMRMRRVPSFTIPAHGELVLEPGSNHLMFFELPAPWVDGEKVDLHLEFDSLPAVDVLAEVRPL